MKKITMGLAAVMLMAGFAQAGEMTDNKCSVFSRSRTSMLRSTLRYLAANQPWGVKLARKSRLDQGLILNSKPACVELV